MKFLAQSALLLSGALGSAQATERTERADSESSGLEPSSVPRIDAPDFHSWLQGVVETLSAHTANTLVVADSGAEGEGVVYDRGASFDFVPSSDPTTLEKDEAAHKVVSAVLATVQQMGAQIGALPRSRTAMAPMAINGMSLPFRLSNLTDGHQVTRTTFYTQKFEAHNRQGPECGAGNFWWPAGVTIREPSRTDFAYCKSPNSKTTVSSVRFPKGTGTQFFGLGQVAEYVEQVGVNPKEADTHIVLATQVSRAPVIDCTEATYVLDTEALPLDELGNVFHRGPKGKVTYNTQGAYSNQYKAPKAAEGGVR